MCTLLQNGSKCAAKQSKIRGKTTRNPLRFTSLTANEKIRDDGCTRSNCRVLPRVVVRGNRQRWHVLTETCCFWTKPI